MIFKTNIMDEIAVSRALKRISHEIIEHNKGADNLALVGIVTRGVPMVNIISENISALENKKVLSGSVDITLYRDDLSELAAMPKINKTSINFEIKNKDIILCDDVLFTGRTARAAMEAILKIGRPKSIQLAVLIDRGHRELPIRADYVGKNIPTSKNEMISVKFFETDGSQSADLFEIKNN